MGHRQESVEGEMNPGNVILLMLAFANLVVACMNTDTWRLKVSAICAWAIVIISHFK